MSRNVFVLLPGAWMGAWIWAGIEERLRARGQVAHAMTLPGLESPPLFPFPVSLETHVRYVTDFLTVARLQDVILVGHSYSGLVAGQVSDRLPERVRHTIFLEAFVPEDGRSLLDVTGLDVQAEQALINGNQGLWPAPDLVDLAHEPALSEADRRFLAERLVDQPGRTVTDPVVLRGSLAHLSATYVGHRAPVVIQDWLTRSEPCRYWQYLRLEGGHWPMLVNPDEVTSLLLTASAAQSEAAESSLLPSRS